MPATLTDSVLICLKRFHRIIRFLERDCRNALLAFLVQRNSSTKKHNEVENENY